MPPPFRFRRHAWPDQPGSPATIDKRSTREKRLYLLVFGIPEPEYDIFCHWTPSVGLSPNPYWVHISLEPRRQRRRLLVMLAGVRATPPCPKAMDKLVLFVAVVLVGWAWLEMLFLLYGIENSGSLAQMLISSLY